MSTPTNPERLWCFLVRNEHIVCQTEGHARLVHDNNFKRLDGEGLVSPVAEYVLASVAATTCREKLRQQALHTEEQLEWATVARNEATALRRERDALMAEVAKWRAARDGAVAELEREVECARGVIERLDVAETETAALRRERDALATALKVADGRIYLLRDTLYLTEGDCSASSERAKLSRERDDALRDGTWAPLPCIHCKHDAREHRVDDEERRECALCQCEQYECDEALAAKGVG